MPALPSSRLAALSAALAVCLTTSGCAALSASFAHRQARPLPSISAKFIGPQGVASVTAVQFVGASDGWFGVVETGALSGTPAGAGTLMRTKDGGRTWTAVSKVPGEILAIDFLTPLQGYVVVQESRSTELMRTSDGGATLTPVSSAPGSGSQVQLSMSSATQGFLVDGQTLDVTSDGGNTWHSSPISLPGPPPATGALPPQAYFLTATEGFVVNGDGLYRTTNGGSAWQDVYVLPAQMLRYYSGGHAVGPISFASPTLGYAVLNVAECWAGGCPDVILRTEDGGATWAPVSAETQGPLPGITAPMTGPPGGIQALLGFGAQGVSAATMMGLYVSHDGGVTWKAATSPPEVSPTQFTNLSYDPEAGVLAGGPGNLVQMTPSGEWRPLWPALAPTAAIDFTSATTGYGIQLQPKMALLKTTNGGRVWKQLYIPPQGWLPGQVSFSGRSGWLLLASSAQMQTQTYEVLATSGGGANWRVVQAPNAQSGQILPSGHGVLLTYGFSGPPSLYTTHDGGRHFTSRGLPHGVQQPGIAFSSARVGYVVAEPKYSNELLYQTTDGGRMWHKLALPRFPQNSIITYQEIATDHAGDLWVLLSQHLYGEPTSVDIYIRYRDGQWREIKMPETASFAYAPQALSAVSARTAWLLLAAGLFETTDGGRVWRNLTSPLPD